VAIHRHVENERAMLASLSEREQQQLDRLLRKLLTNLNGDSPPLGRT